MDEAKKKRLEDKGWKIGSTSEFLELSPEESILIDIKLAQRLVRQLVGDYQSNSTSGFISAGDFQSTPYFSFRILVLVLQNW